MNIFGEGFPEEINKQIQYRQEIYGSGYNTNRTPEQISYLNSNTGWCKLISGVDIDDNKLVNYPTIKNLNLTNNELARKFVLFNGTADSQGTGLRAGIFYGGDNPTDNILGGNSAYGIGGTEFGINPMMGVISANIKHENKGSLRRAEVKIKAHNRAQFEIIDILYLRLGFSVLLEWGHAITIDNGENILFNPQYSLSDIFLQGGLNYDDVLQVIYDQRLKSGGNYDAMLAKVVNFDWSFNQDGSYDITVFLVAIGDIIESLKINILTNTPGINNTDNRKGESNGNEEEQEDISGDIIDTFAYSNDICNFLYTCKSLITFRNPSLKNYTSATSDINFENTQQGAQAIQQTNPSPLSNTIFSDLSAFLTSIIKSTIIDPVQKITNRVINDVGVTFLPLHPSATKAFDILQNYINNNKLNLDLNIFKESGLNQADIMAIEFDNLGDLTVGDDVRYYIRLGAFLKFLEQYVFFNIKSKNNNELFKALKIDTDLYTNVIEINPLQVSVDPRICYVNRELPLNNDNRNYGLGNAISPFYNASLTQNINKDIQYGNIMNIYLDTTFIINKINELKDDKGNLSAINFLQGLLKGLNEGLGGINDFDIFIDETNNYIRIIDNNPLPYIEDVINYLNTNYNSLVSLYNNGKQLNKIDPNAILQLYGYNNSSAGFIKNFSLTSNLSPNFSTMITVGAAANGTVVGADDTGLSKLNKGLSDRYIHTVSSGYKNVSSSINDIQDYNDKKTEFTNMSNDYKQFLLLLSNNFFLKNRVEVEIEDINNNKNTLVSLIQKANELDKLRNKLILVDKISVPSLFSPSSPSSTPTSNPENNIPGISFSFPPNNIPQVLTKPISTKNGFLPFSLNLTLDGISGIKINQQFLLNTDFLPSNYPDILKFLIKNLSHEISNNRWVTKIETYAIPKDPEFNNNEEPSSLYTIFSKISDNTNVTQSSSSKVEIIPFTTSGLISPFLYPIDGFITSKIGSRQGPNGNYHYGIDVGAPKNTPVYAAYSGVVTRIGANGYGPSAVYIAIDPNSYSDPNKIKNKYTCIYGHNNSAVVKKGDRVKAGDLIAYSGDLGSPGSFHLHFQIQGGTIPTGGNKPKEADIVVDLNPYFPDPRGKIKAKDPFSITKPIGLLVPGIP
jgi:murein DD-endopeptidase MepM/ murein hydrolase activator NlpD